MANIEAGVVCPNCGKPYKVVKFTEKSHNSGRNKCSNCHCEYIWETLNGEIRVYIKNKK